MAVASEVGARDDDQEEDTVPAIAFKADETGEGSDGSGRRELAWQVGDEAWICESDA